MNKSEQEELAKIAGELAGAAGRAILPHFRSIRLAAENKAQKGWDPVTAADRDAERAMREILGKRRPRDSIHGEEFDPVEGDSGLTWVLDPIDGTRSFVSGTPVWGVLVSVSDKDGPLYGIIEQPYIGERFEGGFGRATATGPAGRRAISVRGTTDLAQAILFTTLPEVGTAAEGRAFRKLSARTLLTRYGMDCYAYAMLAGGHIDLVVEAGLKEFDVHAPIALVRAAGGVATDWEGGPPHRGGRLIAASSREIHEAALEIISGCP